MIKATQAVTLLHIPADEMAPAKKVEATVSNWFGEAKKLVFGEKASEDSNLLERTTVDLVNIDGTKRIDWMLVDENGMANKAPLNIRVAKALSAMILGDVVVVQAPDARLIEEYDMQEEQGNEEV